VSCLPQMMTLGDVTFHDVTQELLEDSRVTLAPAFDVTYSYNPSGSWTAAHQMTLNGKRDGFATEDFEAGAKSALMKRGRAARIIAEVQAAVRRWPEFAAEARLSDDWCGKIKASHRLIFP